MSHKRPGLSSGAVSTSLAAAALQDHLARQLSLSLSDPLLSKKTQGSLSFHSSRAKRENRIPAVRQTGDPLPESKSSKRDRGQRLTRNGAVEVERVLDPHPPPLSLAQHMGLVERPHPLLTSKEWSQVKIVSQQRQDSSQPCPICQEEFGMSEQVLLSCSHVFHRQCLRSVERYSGRKTCPLCRTTDYQTRLIYDGVCHHRNKAATIIQSWWRGWRVRQWYRKYQEKVPPRDPALRSKYYQKKLTSITSQMVERCSQTSSNADSVLAAADSALAAARSTMRVLAAHHDTDWDSLRCRAITTAPTAECPICISPILPTSNSSHTPSRPISLLSCGHLLHETCVISLEQYCTISDLPQCPLCRAAYQRQPLYH